MLRKKLAVGIVLGGVILLSDLVIHPQVRVAVQDKDVKKQIAQGREIFLNYCASCHGIDATGNGPVAPALKKQPSNLTSITKKYGKFPTTKIRATITGEASLPVHGEKQMPVWGGIINEPELANLVKYLESIQK